MKTDSEALTFALTPADNHRLAGLCGEYNTNLKQIEGHFGVRIDNRGNLFRILGAQEVAAEVERVLRRLYEETAEHETLAPSEVHMALTQGIDGGDDAERLVIRTPKTAVKPQNRRQRLYVRNMLTGDINFGIGPAGTGKTYLAVACAVDALQGGQVDRIVLVRPAVEAGERLGFLPGDIGQKVDPYLRPLYDALYEMYGFDRVARLIERNVIELAPLAYMRGRTLNDAFVILDEAQNTTREQMKMFLTRIGFGSKAVVTGDMTQVDLPSAAVSGLRHAVDLLGHIEGISVNRFKPRDVVRHPLVQSIVEAYEAESESAGTSG